MLSSPEGAGAFTSDDDPQLVGAALPLALKIYEILLEIDPENAELAAAAGRNFVMFSAAFVQMPAEMLDDQYWRRAVEGRERAKKLFRRGRNYLLRSLELKHPLFLETLESGDYDTAMAMLGEEDADAVYWTGLAWLAMASTDPFDLELTSTLDRGVLLLHRAMELDVDNPGIHDAMIQVQISLPEAILFSMRAKSPAVASFMDGYYTGMKVGTGARERALHHYNRSVELSGDTNPSPHITMATAITVKDQDIDAFRVYLEKALAISLDSDADSRLMIILYQERAQWLLDHVEDYFLVGFQ